MNMLPILFGSLTIILSVLLTFKIYKVKKRVSRDMTAPFLTF